MNDQDKIKKARKATLGHLSNEGVIEQASYTLSKESMDAMETISAQMQSAVESKAPSEESSSGLPEDRILDPAFQGMMAPPSLSAASVARRKEVESRLSPIRIDDLFVSGEIRQKVEIRKNRLVVIFRTLKGKEDLYIKRRLNEVKDDVVRYAEDRFLYMLLCAHVHSYNGKELTNIFENGKISNINFDKRFEELCNIPSVLIEEIWVNFRWFEDRVRLALESDNLKSG